MKTDSILKADVLDIIFEHRNKDYGAYTLRKFYNNRLYKSLGLVFLFAVSVFLMSFFRNEKKAGPLVFLNDSTMISQVYHEPPPIPEPPKVNQPRQTPAAVPMNIPALAHPLITSDPVDVTPISNIPGNAPNVPVSNVSGESTGDPDPGPVTTGIPVTSALPPAPAVDKNTPSLTAEIMPAFPGGPDALRKFLQRNLRNPEDMNEGQSVFVKIRFIVGYDGTLKGFETTQDGGAAFNEEVMRVLKKMPQWIPGKTRGENVSVYYVLPVRFTGAAE